MLATKTVRHLSTMQSVLESWRPQNSWLSTVAPTSTMRIRSPRLHCTLRRIITKLPWWIFSWLSERSLWRTCEGSRIRWKKNARISSRPSQSPLSSSFNLFRVVLKRACLQSVLRALRAPKLRREAFRTKSMCWRSSEKMETMSHWVLRRCSASKEITLS
jgi:hypothetical protein